MSSNYKCHIFDFDGVICNSNVIKHNVFKDCVKEFGEEAVQAFSKYHLENLGQNRVLKFKWFFNHLKLNGSIDTFVKDKCDLYKNNTLAEIIKEGPTPHFLDYLDLIKDKKLYIVSGASKDDLIEATKQWNIYDHFEKVLGGEKSKIEHVKELNIPTPSSFYGDAIVDYEAAKFIGSDFFLITDFTFDTSWKDQYRDIKEIKNFGELI